MLSTFAGAGWMKQLSYEQCNNYAGDGDKKGSIRVGADRGCFSYFKRAKKICRKAGGRLPSVNDFKRLASQCGFKVVDVGTEISPKSRECLKKKGFTKSEGSEYFWTRSKKQGVPKYMITVDIYTGDLSIGSSFGNRSSIHCIK